MTKQKTHIEYLETPEQIEAFFKAVGRDDLAEGFDIRSTKSLGVGKSNRQKHKHFKNSRTKRYIPTKSDRYIDGYATTPDVDWVKDSVSLEAMKEAEGHLLRKGTNTVFYNHDTEQPIGKVVGVWVDKKGMFVQILISKADDVKNIWTKIKEKILSSYSIRFIAKKVKVERNEDYDVVNYSIEKMEMLEVSVVGLPMNKEANIVNVRGKSIKSLFKQKGVKDMTKEKKENITSVVKELLPEMLKDAMADSLKEFGENLTKELEVKFEAKKAEESKEDDSEKAEDKTESKADDKADEIKSLKDAVDALTKKLEEKPEAKKSEKDLEDGEKKGAEDNEDEEDETDEVKKSLKSVEDVDTCTFVLKAFDDEEIYESLTDVEKQKCRKLYFQMMAKAKQAS